MPSAELCHWKVALPYPVAGVGLKIELPVTQIDAGAETMTGVGNMVTVDWTVFAQLVTEFEAEQV